MRAIAKLATAALVLAMVVAARHPTAGAGPGYVVIVHPDNPISRLDRRFVRGAFFKKVVSWPGGRTIRPVDLDEHAQVRRQFSGQVLNRSVEAVKSYWQQLIFSGRGVPPPELAGDADVVEYVLRNREALGYVGAGTPIGGARVVAVD